MKKLVIKLAYLSLLLLTLVVFKNWFSFNILSSGDWNFRFENQIESFTIFPYIWSYLLSNTGANINFLLGLHTYFSTTTVVLFRYFNLPWILIERLIWFWPFILISFLSSWYLFKITMPKNIFSFLSPFVFIFNTYILMIVGGGQMGIAMAYSTAPLVLAVFIKLIKEEHFNPKKSILTGLIIALQLTFDPRVFYMTIVSVLIYFMIIQFRNGSITYLIKKFIVVFVIPGIIAFLIHAFWLIPLLVSNQNPIQQLGPAYSSAGAVVYLSFAKFEQTISLLHPYWTENIFGKVGFMRSEFLIVPILAYASLLFVNRLENMQEKRIIVFFALLGLVGAFLAKGANDPFGNIYLLAFDHIPGFMLFRDPTKWYLLVALSYSILIPFSIWRVFDWIKSKKIISFLNFQFSINSKIFNFQNIFMLWIFCYLFFIVKPAWMGQLTGTFKQKSISQDYIKLENYLSKDKVFYRTFWAPTYERFGFRSDVHPAISGQDFLNKYNLYDITKYLTDKNSQVNLQNLAVKYVIVPFDSQREIFLKDREYNHSLYLKTIDSVRKISWLKEIKGFGKIAVFEISNPRDHFWSTKESLIKSYKNINPTKYVVDVQNAKKGDVIVFAESYDSKWVAINDSIQINSKRFDKLFNSFTLPRDGNYQLEVYYTPQKYVEVGLVVSLVTFVSIVLFLISSFKRGKSR